MFSDLCSQIKQSKKESNKLTRNVEATKSWFDQQQNDILNGIENPEVAQALVAAKARTDTAYETKLLECISGNETVYQDAYLMDD